MAYNITEKCIGCTACLKICPVDAIAGERSELHVIDPAICVDCSACGRVCPVDAIEDQFGAIIPHMKRAEWPKPIIVEEACTGCNFCVDVCPEHCLEVMPGGSSYGPGHGFGDIAVLVNPKTCIGCHFCEDVCAKNAIVMTDHIPADAVA